MECTLTDRLCDRVAKKFAKLKLNRLKTLIFREINIWMRQNKYSDTFDFSIRKSSFSSSLICPVY